MKKCFIVAEVGVNHNGCLNTAKKMVVEAARAGADAVKIQNFKTSAVLTKDAKKVPYQSDQSDGEESLIEMISKLELKDHDLLELFRFAKSEGVDLFSTAFDLESLNLLVEIGVQRFKVPSGDITNFPLLQAIAKLHQPTAVSSGMASLGEIEAALQVFDDNGFDFSNLTVLHCTTAYPAPFDSVNLKAMDTISSAFPGVQTGFSDHTSGINVAIAAAARGATFIEKHFTLDKDLPGPDHQASLEPSEMKQMVQAIREVEKAMGSPRKKISYAELENISAVRRSIVAKFSISKGDVFTEDNLTTKRPGTGRNPMEWPSVIGQKAVRDYEVDEPID